MTTRRITVIATGGTIGKLGSGPWDLLDYQAVGERVPVSRLLQDASRDDPGLELTGIDLASQSSKSYTPQFWASLSATVAEAVADRRVDGVVVTHGTSSLEESAIYLDLTVDARVPIVMGGALRPLGAHGSDALVNLDAAIRVAADPASIGRGVLVTLNNHVHRAFGLTKGSATDVDAFVDRTFGPVGRVGSHAVHYAEAPPGRRHRVLEPSVEAALPRVDVSYAVVGADGVDIDAFVRAGARGIIVAGMGTGYPALGQRERLAAARAEDVLLVATSRTGRAVLELPSDLSGEGIVTAGNLTPQQARVLAIVALAAGGSSQAAAELITERLRPAA